MDNSKELNHIIQNNHKIMLDNILSAILKKNTDDATCEISKIKNKYFEINTETICKCCKRKIAKSIPVIKKHEYINEIYHLCCCDLENETI